MSTQNLELFNKEERCFRYVNSTPESSYEMTCLHIYLPSIFQLFRTIPAKWIEILDCEVYLLEKHVYSKEILYTVIFRFRDGESENLVYRIQEQNLLAPESPFLYLDPGTLDARLAELFGEDLLKNAPIEILTWKQSV